MCANAICREYCKVFEGELRAANIPVTVVPILLPFIQDLNSVENKIESRNFMPIPNINGKTRSNDTAPIPVNTVRSDVNTEDDCINNVNTVPI